MPSFPNFARLSLKLIGALLLVLVVLIGGAFFYVFLQKRSYARLGDTGDLTQRVERMAKEYLQSRTNGALVVGLIQKSQSLIKGYGAIHSAAGDQSPAEDRLFEIGSITKVFTAPVLAKMDADGLI